MVYLSRDNFVGQDFFVYEICMEFRSQTLCDTANVTVDVTAIPTDAKALVVRAADDWFVTDFGNAYIFKSSSHTQCPILTPPPPQQPYSR